MAKHICVIRHVFVHIILYKSSYMQQNIFDTYEISNESFCSSIYVISISVEPHHTITEHLQFWILQE